MSSARLIRAGTSRASPPGSTAGNAKMGGMHRSDLIILAGRPAAWARPRSPPISRSTRAQRLLRLREDAGEDAKSLGAGVASSASKCRRTSSPRASSPSNLGSAAIFLRMGKISQHDFLSCRTRRRRSRTVAALYRRYPAAYDRGAAHARTPAQATARDRPDHRRLSPAAVGFGARERGQPRAGDFGDSRGLKQLAKELNVPASALSQSQPAGREPREQAADPPDLREFGFDRAGRRSRPVRLPRGILRQFPEADRAWAVTEFDPTNVAFREWQSAMERVHGVAEVVGSKSRHGSTGTIPVLFDAKITRFSDLADFGTMWCRIPSSVWD